MSDRVDELSQMGQTSHLSGVLDSLKGKSSNFVQEFRDYDRYKYEYGRGSFFARGNDQVKEDLEYALATVQKIVGAAGVMKQQQKSAGQTQQLDAEIEKLKKQMEEMDDDGGGGE
jgi:hypothetical protein